MPVHPTDDPTHPLMNPPNYPAVLFYFHGALSHRPSSSCCGRRMDSLSTVRSLPQGVEWVGNIDWHPPGWVRYGSLQPAQPNVGLENFFFRVAE